MTLYELAKQRGRLISENMIKIDLDDEVWLFLWIRHGQKSNINEAYLGAGVADLDREVWKVLTQCVSEIFSVGARSEPCKPILKHCGARLPWGLATLPKGLLNIFTVLREKELTELDTCVPLLTFEKLVRHSEEEWIAREWADVSPLAQFALYELMRRWARRRFPNLPFHGLHPGTLAMVDNVLAPFGSANRADIQAFIQKIPEYSAGL